MRRRGMTSPIVVPERRGAPLLAEHAEQARAMRQKVQIGKKQLGLTDDDYRAVLLRVTGKESSTKCGPSDLEALLKEFQRLGWKPARTGTPVSGKAQVRMIHAVWADMQPLLAVGGPDALRSFVQRQTKDETHPDGIAAPEFLDAKQANKVLEGLKAWRARLAAL